MKAPAKPKKPNPGSKPYEVPKDLSRFGTREPVTQPEAMVVCVPFPPSMNHMYRSVGNRSVLSVLGRSYKELCAVILAPAAKLTPPSAPIRADIVLAVPDLVRRDYDNLGKAMWDVIAPALGFDDSEVWEGTFEKRLDRKNPRASVLLSPGRPALMEDHA